MEALKRLKARLSSSFTGTTGTAKIHPYDKAIHGSTPHPNSHLATGTEMKEVRKSKGGKKRTRRVKSKKSKSKRSKKSKKSRKSRKSKSKSRSRRH
jgi:hypothetical protein